LPSVTKKTNNFKHRRQLGNLFHRVAFTDVICVVDPPRGGIGPKAINQIRKNEAVRKLVR
jgi:tRNA/tmRNA/rRNA uracil-C5-methylase (TrmA/RlmC/RlmD family)